MSDQRTRLLVESGIAREVFPDEFHALSIQLHLPDTFRCHLCSYVHRLADAGCLLKVGTVAVRIICNLRRCAHLARTSYPFKEN